MSQLRQIVIVIPSLFAFILVVSLLTRPAIFRAQRQFLVNPAVKAPRHDEPFTPLEQLIVHSNLSGSSERPRPNSSEINIIGKVSNYIIRTPHRNSSKAQFIHEGSNPDLPPWNVRWIDPTHWWIATLGLGPKEIKLKLSHIELSCIL